MNLMPEETQTVEIAEEDSLDVEASLDPISDSIQTLVLASLGIEVGTWHRNSPLLETNTGGYTISPQSPGITHQAWFSNHIKLRGVRSTFFPRPT
jgi:hypothetical protein